MMGVLRCRPDVGFDSDFELGNNPTGYRQQPDNKAIFGAFTAIGGGDVGLVSDTSRVGIYSSLSIQNRYCLYSSSYVMSRVGLFLRDP
jgi:hypothetical protein